jgi:hypothetical protein
MFERVALAALVVGYVGVAAATPSKEVQAVVKAHLVALPKASDDTVLGLADGATLIGMRGDVIDIPDEYTGCGESAVADYFYGCLQADVSHKVGKIEVGVAGDLAWFQASYTVTFRGEDPETGKPVKDTNPMRFGGVVAKAPGGWQIVAGMYTAPISDRELMTPGRFGFAKLPSGPPTLTGDQPLARTIAGWFSTGFAANAATPTTLIASGTSPTEHKAGAAAAKLAASWDKLHLAATAIDAKLLAGGKLGWVTAKVALPRKGKDDAVEIQLGAVVIPQGEGWRWVSLQYLSSSFR